jgi:cytochrome c553
MVRGKGRTPLLLLAAAVIGFAPRMSAAESQAPDASVQEASFEQHCAACHAIPTTRAPTRSSMRAMAPSFIVEALTSGMMKAQGSALTSEERVALAEYLTGRKVGAEAPMAGRCAAASPPLSLDGPSFNGWGGNLENWRFQPAPGLTAAHLLGDSGHLGRLIELLSGARGSTLPQPHP